MCVSPIFAKNRNSHAYKNHPILTGRVDVDEFYPRQLNAFFYNKLFYTSKWTLFCYRRVALPPWTTTPARSGVTLRTPVNCFHFRYHCNFFLFTHGLDHDSTKRIQNLIILLLLQDFFLVPVYPRYTNNQNILALTDLEYPFFHILDKGQQSQAIEIPPNPPVNAALMPRQYDALSCTFPSGSNCFIPEIYAELAATEIAATAATGATELIT